MAFQFAPSSNVSLQPFNAPQNAQMGANVDANPLSSLANISSIDTQQQALKKAEATYKSDVQSAKAQADTATANAKSAQVKLGNEQMNTMYSVLAPYGSDERLLKAETLNGNSTPEDFKAVQNSLYDVSDEIDKGLEARGWTKADRRQYIHELNDSIVKDPRQAPALIKRATQTLAGATNIAEQNQPRFEKNAAGEFVQVTPSRKQVGNVMGGGTNANPTTGGVTSTNEYIKDLNARNATALETDMRLGEAKELLKTIKGGAGTKNFAEIAKWAQAANLPQSVVDSIAGGDLSAVQSAQKFITQAVIQGATSNPGTAESINRYIKDNPDIGTDPRALDRFIKFTEKLNSKTFDETQFLLEQKRSGKFNPDTHVQEMQQHLRKKYLNHESKSESKPEIGSEKKVVREYQGGKTGRTIQVFEDGTKAYK